MESVDPNELDLSHLGELLDELERELGLKKNFLFELAKEDDWSFIVKMHAVFESAISHLLVEVTHLTECAEIFAKLPVSDKNTGKIAFVKALDLLDKNERRFLSTLSEVRNYLIHNAKNIDFNIKAYANALPQGKKRNVVEAFFYGHRSYIDPMPESPTFEEFFSGEPRMMLWAKGTLVMVKIAVQIRSARKSKHFQEWELERAKKLEELLSEYVKGTT